MAVSNLPADYRRSTDRQRSVLRIPVGLIAIFDARIGSDRVPVFVLDGDIEIVCAAAGVIVGNDNARNIRRRHAGPSELACNARFRAVLDRDIDTTFRVFRRLEESKGLIGQVLCPRQIEGQCAGLRVQWILVGVLGRKVDACRRDHDLIASVDQHTDV